MKKKNTEKKIVKPTQKPTKKPPNLKLKLRNTRSSDYEDIRIDFGRSSLERKRVRGWRYHHESGSRK